MNRFMQLCVLMFFVLTLNACGKKEETKIIPGKPVKVKETVTLRFKSYRTISGMTYANKDIVISSEIAGQIEQIPIEIGDFVKKGKVIARIDQEMAKAQRQSAKANLSLAQTNYNLQKKLFRKKLVSEQQFEAIKTQLEVAKSNYKLAEIQYGNTLIKAPVSGFIAGKYIEEGEFATPGKPVLRIVDIGKIKVRMSMPGKEIRFLKAKDIVNVNIPSIEKKLQGIVNSIGLVAHQKSKTFTVEVIVSNPSNSIRVGQLCNVTFLTNLIPNAIIIPRDSILEGEHHSVFVAENDKAVQKTVIIQATEKNQAAVKGITVGEKLIYIGHKNLVKGERIKIVN
jgi:membrane fusion protein, multidrug efflux system